jgi:hypothetical protein
MWSRVRDGGTGVYMREGPTSRVTAADRPYGEFYVFYSVSPENLGSTHLYSLRQDVFTAEQTSHLIPIPHITYLMIRTEPT